MGRVGAASEGSTTVALTDTLRGSFMRRAFAAVVVAGFLATGFSLVAQAQQPAEELDESQIPGTLRVRMNKDFGKVIVDGEDWAENTDFVNNGYTAIINGLDRSREHTVRIEPAYDGFAPVEFTVKPKDFKRIKHRKGRVWILEFVAKRKIKFKKAKPVPAKPANPPSKNGGAKKGK